MDMRIRLLYEYYELDFRTTSTFWITASQIDIMLRNNILFM